MQMSFFEKRRGHFSNSHLDTRDVEEKESDGGKKRRSPGSRCPAVKALAPGKR